MCNCGRTNKTSLLTWLYLVICWVSAKADWACSACPTIYSLRLLEKGLVFLEVTRERVWGYVAAMSLKRTRSSPLIKWWQANGEKRVSDGATAYQNQSNACLSISWQGINPVSLFACRLDIQNRAKAMRKNPRNKNKQSTVIFQQTITSAAEDMAVTIWHWLMAGLCFHLTERLHILFSAASCSAKVLLVQHAIDCFGWVRFWFWFGSGWFLACLGGWWYNQKWTLLTPTGWYG